ncbi:MAG: bifunctional adenosylcobinamide kinase/adenosylcobinamide-phosphate guanylyltransferase [Thermodesulfobacteriota bacterium]
METGKFVFVIGGARSGKSAFALKLAGALPSPRRYLATALALDQEMRERVEAHKKERGGGWETIEEPRDVGGALHAIGDGVVLVDCLTLWLTNLVEAGLTDAEIEEEARRLCAAACGSKAAVIAVSNEVGLGIVPANGLARRFRDLSGMVNRLCAEAAAEVYFLAAGIPMRMK